MAAHCAELGNVVGGGGGVAAFGRDHRHGAFGERQIAVDDQHIGAGAGQQDCRRAAVADAVTLRPAAGDDRHLSDQAPFLVRCHRIQPLSLFRRPLSRPATGCHDFTTGRTSLANSLRPRSETSSGVPPKRKATLSS